MNAINYKKIEYYTINYFKKYIIYNIYYNMPPKKSMKSNVNNQALTETKSVKSKNIFDALLCSDEENSSSDEEINTEPVKQTLPIKQIQSVKQEESEKQESVEQSQPTDTSNAENVEQTTTLTSQLDGENKKNDMLNISGNINIAEFINDNKNKFKKESKFKQDMKYDEKVLEYKQTYEELHDYGDIGNELKLNSHWTVWVHKSDNQDWTLHGYQKRYIINSIGSFWRFFNNFQFYDCYKNQLFIMRGEIAPIWEDVNNKFGGICSIKIDSTQRGFKTDISTEIFISICMLIMNETFIANNEDINGISYAVKKKNILIKIWTKTFYEDNKFVAELPKQLMNKFNSELQKQLINVFGPDYKMSIQYKKIKPEYDM